MAMAFVDAVLGSGRAGRITMQEMRMGTRRRQQAQPRCGREFLAVISALGQNNNDNDAPDVRQAASALHACTERSRRMPRDRTEQTQAAALSMRRYKKK